MTPPADAERLARGLARHRHLVLTGEGHGQLATGCMPRLMADFLDAPRSARRSMPAASEQHRPAPFFVGCHGTCAMIEAYGAVQAIRRGRGGARRVLPRGRRRDHRAPRAERRRQIDHAAHAVWRARPRRRQRAHRRHRHPRRDLGGARPSRRPAARRGPVRQSHRAREHRVFRRAARHRRRRACARALAELRARSAWQGFIDRRAKGFSQGQRIKVALARALIHDPANLVLDEPTNGLDVMAIRNLREILRDLKSQGRCILFSSHVMQEVAALCDRVVIIGHGRVLAEGTARGSCASAAARPRSRKRSSTCSASARRGSG